MTIQQPSTAPIIQEINLFSPAKVNLFLHFVNQRKDGYHNLQTVFALLNWGDSISLSIASESTNQNEVEISGMENIAQESNHSSTVLLKNNLMYKAVKAFSKASGIILPAISIKIRKKIPMGAGLGGGSSNAASVLLGLNQYYKALSHQEMLAIGANIGADVPVFINQQHAWAEGIGDELYPIQLQPIYILLALPNVSVNTALAFGSEHLERLHEPLQRLQKISCEDWSHNHFEMVIRSLYPQVDNCFKVLGKVGKPRLSGSGSSVFLAFKTQRQANIAMERLRTSTSTHQDLPFKLIQVNSL